MRHLSTNLQVESMDIITDALNVGYGVDVVYLDVIKAFDTVPHNRLIVKLGAVGISGHLLFVPE